ncbi:MAG: septal ring lytic transglycosylase RlpA family protein [Alphaproteobacteria bacterium]|nr:septal ring lytic transglycosylase RlpA family protein [Alphaproteobacteria bacterium]
MRSRTVRIRCNNKKVLLLKKRILTLLLLVAACGQLAACAGDTSKGRFRVGGPYTINGHTYYPEENYTYEETGLASWYGPGFDGRKTASGETFDEDALTAAHRTLQLPSLVRVTNLDNGRSIVVRVTDRGPFHSNRIIDVSKGAAKALGMIGTGTAKVRLQVLGPESMALSAAAKQKIDTRGAEIAVNNTGMLDDRFASFYPTADGQMPEQTPIRVATATQYLSDAEPAPVVASAADIGMNTQAVITPVVPENIAPAAGGAAMAAPVPADLPPQRRNDEAAQNKLAFARPRGARYPGIPVATLQPEDVIPKPSYASQTVRPQIVPVKPSFIYVQAGSYTSSANAQRAQAQIASLGPTKIIEAKLGGKPYYRVRIGPISNPNEADALVSALQRQGRQASIVVSEN